MASSSGSGYGKRHPYCADGFEHGLQLGVNLLLINSKNKFLYR